MTTENETSGSAPENKRDLVSLILGILSLLFWLVPLFGFPISIAGLVFGVKRKYTPRNDSEYHRIVPDRGQCGHRSLYGSHRPALVPEIEERVKVCHA
ncbi:MAG: hypothetical protein BWY31_02166 [Lentisphaerae bacterium ADurb.Bin242]|nr:MAG: hypothetical protein BWY31_02166 [Lentisphaerae bacterium ADurb.Bin242]